jgi:hypothetical protein
MLIPAFQPARWIQEHRLAAWYFFSPTLCHLDVVRGFIPAAPDVLLVNRPIDDDEGVGGKEIEERKTRGDG